MGGVQTGMTRAVRLVAAALLLGSVVLIVAFVGQGMAAAQELVPSGPGTPAGQRGPVVPSGPGWAGGGGSARPPRAPGGLPGWVEARRLLGSTGRRPPLPLMTRAAEPPRACLTPAGGSAVSHPDWAR